MRSPLPPPLLALGIVVLTLVTRLRAYLCDQGDPNVGLYYYMAHLLLRGSLPYVGAWEYKPPGFFAMCAAALLVLRDAALATHALAAAAVVVAALSAYAILAACDGEDARLAGSAAAFAIVLLSTENAGLLGDAELFVNAFAGLAFAFVLALRGRWAAFFGGLAAAAALQMKLTAIPMLVAVAATLWLRFGSSTAGLLGAYAALVAAPFALEAMLYARFGSLPYFLDANVGATLRRAFSPHAGLNANQGRWGRELLLLAPFLEASVFAFVRPSRGTMVAAAWLCAAIAAIVAAGEYFDRHFVLLVPPVAMLGGLGLIRVAARFRMTLVAVALVATFALHGAYEGLQGARVLQHRYVLGESRWHSGDYAEVLRTLRAALKTDRSFFAIEISPEFYEDLHATAPTRYAFTGNLLEARMWPMIGFPGRREFARTLGLRSHFIAYGPLGARTDAESAALLERTLAREYRFVCEVRTVRIYELRGLARRAPPHGV